MPISYGGVTLPATTGTDEDSGTKPVTEDGDTGGSIWDTIFGNAGSVLLGGAALVNAFKGNQPVTNVYQTPGANGAVMSLNNIWIWIGLALVIIIILFLALKK